MTAQTILPANSVVDSGFNVANSCRFDNAGDDSLTRSKGASETSVRKATYSFWIKRAEAAGTSMWIYSNEVANDNNRGYIEIDGNDNFRIIVGEGSDTQIYFITDAEFRDFSAWSHWVISIDTTQATEANRVKIYLNGVQVTSFSTATYPGRNADLTILVGGQTNKEHIGNIHGQSAKLSAYLCEFVFIDGLQLAADQFGEFDNSGIWKPIDPSGLTFGNEGFYLNFQTAAELGDDVSGNTNDFSENNLTAVNQATDTCTNNFATLNPSYHLNGGAVFSEGNLKFTTSGNSSNARGVSTIRPENGKWYVECKVIDKTRFQIGLMNNNEIPAAQGGDDTNSVLLGYGGDFYYNGTGFSDYIADINNNDIVQLALDLDNNLFWFGVNNTWGNSATRTEIENATATNSGSTDISSTTPISIGAIGIFLEDNSGTGNHVSEINFGNPSFTGTDQADGNGFGSFEYAPPSGYLALCTKNLATNG